MKEKTYLLQQDEVGSNIWSCSNCKFEFFWNECGEDMKEGEIKFCPHCGNKIEEYIFIEDKTDEMEEIKELDEWVTRRNGEVTQSEAKIIEIGNKLNELVKAVNKLNKQDTATDTNCISE